MIKEFDVTVKIHAIIEDMEETTDQTIRYLIEQDLRDAGWDVDVEVRPS